MPHRSSDAPVRDCGGTWRVASSKRDERLAAWLLFLWRFAGDFLQPPAFFTARELRPFWRLTRVEPTVGGSRAPTRSSRDYEMRAFRLVMIAASLACGTYAMAGDIAPGGTLRAAYLGTNPAQAMRDPATGELRGPAYDLA